MKELAIQDTAGDWHIARKVAHRIMALCGLDQHRCGTRQSRRAQG